MSPKCLVARVRRLCRVVFFFVVLVVSFLCKATRGFWYTAGPVQGAQDEVV